MSFSLNILSSQCTFPFKPQYPPLLNIFISQCLLNVFPSQSLLFWFILLPAWPIQWLLWRINQNEAAISEGRLVIRLANLLAFISKWNCATTPTTFFFPGRSISGLQISQVFHDLLAYQFWWGKVRIAAAEKFNLSVGQADKWGFQAWSWLLSIYAIGRIVRRAYAMNLVSAGAVLRDEFGCKKGRPGLRYCTYGCDLNLRYSCACLSY